MGLASAVVISSVTHWVQDFWVFYRRYTDTTAHTATTAALAIFGILVFVDPWFAVAAIACYVVPPVALYVLADEPVPGPERSVGRRGSEEQTTETRARDIDSVAARSETARSSDEALSRSNSDAGIGDTNSNADGESIDSDSDSRGTDTDSDDGDTDTDSDGTDTDSDGTDTDSGGTDRDTDSNGRDTDTDSDDGDTDTDSDDGDTDTDSDDGDADSDSDDGDTDT